MLPVMERVLSNLKENLTDKDESEDIDFSKLLLKVATDINIGEVAFGERFGLTKENPTVTSSNPAEVSEFIK